jgi:hypothetical protein
MLIHRRRNRDERAKDILYMHDTIDTFATRIDDLGVEWVRDIRHQLHASNVRTVQSAATTLFRALTDPIRAASRIARGRNRIQKRSEKPVTLGSIGFSERGN